MKPLYTQEQFNNSKSTEKLPCECYECNNTFLIKKNEITRIIKNNLTKGRFCSHKCFYLNKTSKVLINCSYCNTPFLKELKRSIKTKNHFCSQSCAAYYRNKHKSHGTRRSKLEIYIENQLTQLYPNLHIDYNKTSAIGSELDIYIPSLNIAFELNGIFHYEPIYGVDKLQQIQENDVSKSKACHDAKIDLCIIDTSTQKKFKESSSQKFLSIITNIINQRT